MGNENKTIQIGKGYSVNLTAFANAAANGTVKDSEKRAFINGITKEVLANFYDSVDKVRDEGGKLIINISNHPYSSWDKEQVKACGDAVIVDLPHPTISPLASAEDMDIATFSMGGWLCATLPGIPEENVTFVIAGAQGFVFRLVGLLKMEGYTCLEACSDRNTISNADGSKTVKFEFKGFRSF